MAFDLGKLTARLGIDTKGLDAAAARMKAFGGEVSSTLQRNSKSMQKIGRGMSTYLTLPIVGAGAAILKMAGDFQYAMNEVGALTKGMGATNEQFEKMRDLAKELGATTQYTATEAAEGMAFLARAGLKVNEILEATPNMLNLAAAAQVGLGEAADMATNILKGMGMETSELGRVTDILTQAFISSNTTLTELADAMVYAAPLASQTGQSIEEVAAMLAFMANAGIKASMAGTTVRGAIARLLSPVGKAGDVIKKYNLAINDSTGAMRPFRQILGDLKRVGASAAEIMELFGLRAGPGMLVSLAAGEKAIKEYMDTLNNSGITSDIAAARMEGFKGGMKGLKSAIEGLAIEIGDAGLLGAMTGIVDSLTLFIRKLNQTSPMVLRVITVFAGFLAVLGPILWIGGKLITVLTTLGAAVTSAAVPFVAAAGLIAGVGYALYEVYNMAFDVIDAFKELYNRSGEIWQNFKDEMLKIWNAIKDGVMAVWKAMWNAIPDYMKKKAQAALDWLKGWGKSVIKTFDATAVESVHGSIIPDMMDAILAQFGRLDQGANTVVAANNRMIASFQQLKMAGVGAPGMGAGMGMAMPPTPTGFGMQQTWAAPYGQMGFGQSTSYYQPSYGQQPYGQQQQQGGLLGRAGGAAIGAAGGQIQGALGGLFGGGEESGALAQMAEKMAKAFLESVAQSIQEKLKEKLMELFTNLFKETIGGAVEEGGQKLLGSMAEGTGLLEKAGEFLLDVGKGMGNFLKGAGKALGKILVNILKAIPGIGGLFSFLPFHHGGIVKAHRGLAVGYNERLILAQTGEGIVSRKGMRNLGTSGLADINAGRDVSSSEPVIVNIYPKYPLSETEVEYLTRTQIIPAIDKYNRTLGIGQ
jgi:TP901 family phage tail tape measure protein